MDLDTVFFIAPFVILAITFILVEIKKGTLPNSAYFISYITQKNHQPAYFQNCVTDIHPIDWQIQVNESNNGIRYRVINWNIITKKQADKFTEGKSK